jgi:Mrp family chromosome partitioning ATPase
MSVLAAGALARVRFVEAESALTAVRLEAATVAAARAAADTIADTVATIDPARRDTLNAHVRTLEGLIARAEQSPLPSSYKALAQAPDLRDDPRVHAFVDSLTEIEREREGFGAVGGVDPIFVALTSRANEIGKNIRAIAGERVRVIRAELTGINPAAPPVAAAPAVDTSLQVATRDSARLAMQQAGDSIARLRAISQRLDLDEDRARERAAAVAPPLALLASAFVLSAVVGFAVAFFDELRRPRVADAHELERMLAIRVLSTVEPAMPSVERGRRRADRAAPPYLDPGAEGYQLAYLGLATGHPTLLSATVTGDEPSIAAVVACNLAAVAAEEARTTLVLDLDASCSVSAALRTRVQPGITEILAGAASWPDARVAAQVGRDKSVDLVPFGMPSSRPAPDKLVALVRQDGSRLARYYDAIFAATNPDVVSAGLPDALPSADVIYVARPGYTSLRVLGERLDAIRAAGGLVRGVVLWNADRPLLPTPRELSEKSRPKRVSAPREPVSA